jgi:hypothetical protein
MSSCRWGKKLCDWLLPDGTPSLYGIMTDLASRESSEWVYEDWSEPYDISRVLLWLKFLSAFTVGPLVMAWGCWTLRRQGWQPVVAAFLLVAGAIYGFRWTLAQQLWPVGGSLLLVGIGPNGLHVHVRGRGIDVPYRHVKPVDTIFDNEGYGLHFEFTADANAALRPTPFRLGFRVEINGITQFEADNLSSYVNDRVEKARRLHEVNPWAGRATDDVRY